MPQIIMTAGAPKNDGAVTGLVMKFLQKLAENDAAPGLHIEPIRNVMDKRVRTGRVNDNFRAVLFKLAGGDQATYLYVGTWPHDEAIRKAQNAVLKINPINGIPEIRSTTSYAPPPTLTPAPPSADDSARPEPVADVESVAGPDSVATPVPGTPAPAAPAAPVVPILEALGVALSDLTDELGIDLELATAAMKATSEDEILAIVDGAVPWQEHAIIAVAAGQSVGETKEELGIGVAPAPDVEKGGDEAVIEALRHPAAQMQFAFIEDNEELRAVLESGDFAAWRTFLHPEQRKYATGKYNGPFRLSGGAGTGKTVVLVHRARELAKRDPEARILLTTFTRTLADSLKASLRLLDPSIQFAKDIGEPGVYVSGIDALAQRVYSKAGSELRSKSVAEVLGSSAGDLRIRNEQSPWVAVIDSHGGELGAALANPTFLQAEYELIVLPARIKTRDEYFAVRRPGRGVALDRAKRAGVWDLIAAYRSAAAAEDSAGHDEFAAVASVIGENQSPLFDHVLVDEGQDLTPCHWQLLRAIAAEGQDDIFIAEDSHQRIFGHPVVLGRLGINIVGRSRRLTLNYRTTAQNLRYAMSILAGEEYTDVEGEEESMSGYRSARRGPHPRALATSSLSDELDKTVELLKMWIGQGRASESLGVLVRDNAQINRVVTGMAERDLTVRPVTRDKAAGNGQPLVMTMHRAKGMEFECVIILGASKGELPAAYLVRNLADADREDLLQRERSLLYVSATRARDELVVLWSGEPSEMLPV